MSPVLFFLLIAYQLRVCQPPTSIPNAEILTEDDEFEIGNMRENTAVFQTQGLLGTEM